MPEVQQCTKCGRIIESGEVFVRFKNPSPNQPPLFATKFSKFRATAVNTFNSPLDIEIKNSGSVKETGIVPLENLERSERMRVTSFIISSMLTTLMTLLATLSSIFRSRAALELENLALRHQIGVLRRTAAKRLKLTSADRLLWICLSRLWRGWHSALTIVKPETVIAWHRAGFRLCWTWKVRCGQPGRPIISPEVRALIRKMGRENPSWGAPRIHGELLKLGFNVGENTWCAHANRHLRPGAHSSRFTPSNWCPSTSSPCPPSASRSSTCFWYWPMIGVVF
jgi:hypothetical protein